MRVCVCVGGGGGRRELAGMCRLKALSIATDRTYNCSFIHEKKLECSKCRMQLLQLVCQPLKFFSCNVAEVESKPNLCNIACNSLRELTPV